VIGTAVTCCAGGAHNLPTIKARPFTRTARYFCFDFPLVASLHTQLRQRPCLIYPSDTGLYTYPDITVVCDKPQFDDHAAGENASLDLRSIDCTLTLADVYAKLEFED
jgi:hypothetical protein